MRTMRAAIAGLLLLTPLSALAQASEAEPAYAYIPLRPPLTSEAREAAQGITAFAADIYKAAQKPGEDIFLSPASISTAVALAYAGARGTTATEMQRVLRYPAAPAAFTPANAALVATMKLDAPGRELRTANRLYVQQDLKLAPAWVDDMTRYYGAPLDRVDFRDTPAAIATVNRWVETETRDRIRDLLREDDISAETRAVLVNTLYFKAAFGAPFEPKNTKTEMFRLLDGRKLQTPLMHQRAMFNLIEHDGVQVVALPYRNGETEMVVILPRSPKGLPTLEAALTPERLTAWLRELDDAPARDTILTLPRFHLAWRVDLGETLQAMGMPTAFGDDADFGAMKPFDRTSRNPEDKGLKIAKVIHQTWLDVDEKGSEAAAATAVVMDIIVTSARITAKPPPPVIFRADRPFLFLIRDTRTGVPLFIGRVANGIEQPAG